MAKAKRKLNPNADLIKAVQDHTDQIIDFYEAIQTTDQSLCSTSSVSNSRVITTMTTRSG